ncbi:MAG TPA: M56 family metallopeptidase [Hyphomonadaceae bacterium]
MANDLVFLLLKLTLAASATILLVLTLRSPMRRMFGARVAYVLWLIVPVGSLAVLLPARTTNLPSPVTTAIPQPPPAGTVAITTEATDPVSVGAALDLSPAIAMVWLTGAIAALALLAFRQRAFTASLGRLSCEHPNRRTLRAEATGIGPALIGSLFPKLVLPRDFETRFDETERSVVLAHEDIHLRGRDPLINAFVALAQCLNWFNPLVHIAAHVLRIDQELACDAAVIARFPNAKRSYAEAMLKTQIAPASLPLGCYWPAQDEHPLKQRIAMLKRDLPSELRAAWGVLIVAAACLASGCVVWVGQPPRAMATATAEINAPVSPAQAARDSRLLEAIRWGDVRRLESAIAAGADVNARDRSGTTAVVILARADDVQSLRLLLEHGADPNLVSPGEGNALAAAARRGQLRSVMALVEHGARVNDMAPGIGTPLAASVRTGQLNVVRYLVENGADVSLPSPPQAPWDRWGVERTPLDWAVNGDHTEIETYLRFKGATM